MMTRSPVKVTIADGPRHIASFPDAPDKYYRLDDEEHLKQLRAQIEHRMARACHGGLTISSEVVPINVEGPGLRNGSILYFSEFLHLFFRKNLI